MKDVPAGECRLARHIMDGLTQMLHSVRNSGGCVRNGPDPSFTSHRNLADAFAWFADLRSGGRHADERQSASRS
jgi:hypothetical protein